MRRLIYIFLLAISSNVLAQDATQPKFRHSVYIEFGGVVIFPYSVNYEISHHSVALRVGGVISSIKYYNSPDLKSSKVYFIPLEFLVLFNKNKPNSFELGCFVTPSYGNRVYNLNIGTKFPPNYFHYYSDLIGGLQIGWRSSPLNSHFLFRIDYTLLFLSKAYNEDANYSNGLITPWAALSLGYSFKKLK